MATAAVCTQPIARESRIVHLPPRQPSVPRGVQILDEAEISADSPEKEASTPATRRVRGFLGRAKQQVCTLDREHAVTSTAPGLRGGGPSLLKRNKAAELSVRQRQHMVALPSRQQRMAAASACRCGLGAGNELCMCGLNTCAGQQYC